MISDQRLRARLTQRRNGWEQSGPEPTADDLAYARALTRDPCSYCGTLGGTIDHIDHDEHGWTNLTATCRRCNSAKGQHTLTRFLLAQKLRAERTALTDEIRKLGESHGDRYGGPLAA